MSRPLVRALIFGAAIVSFGSACELSDESEPCVDGESGCYCTIDTECATGLACIGTTCLPPGTTTEPSPDASDPDADTEGADIRFTDSGFVPNDLRVQQDSVVRITNASNLTLRLDLSLFGLPGVVEVRPGDDASVTVPAVGTFLVFELTTSARLDIEVVP